jgi:pimeloyl-ACP methyl ester carboxylesterase
MPARVAAVLVLILAFASCGGGGVQPRDRMIDVGTHRLHIHCEGEGSPTVVIDVGIASTSEEWRPLQKQLAEITHVCTYDRAGYGQSEPGPLPRDSGRTADELRALLRGAAMSGPYILVGHSLGALNMQIYAVRYPDDVAGMVLLDPPPLSWMLGECYPDLLQMAEEMTNEWQAIADSRSDSSDPQVRTETAFFRTIASEHREMLGESAALAAAIETFGDIPLTVIASGVPNPMFGAIADEYQQYWIEQSRALAGKSTRGKFVLAAESSHHLHKDASSTVQEAIVSMVKGLRSR